MIKEVTNKQKETKEIGFPKFMIGAKGNIILATSIHGCRIYGTLVAVGESNGEIGDYSESWDVLKFTDYNEPITLQNETE